VRHRIETALFGGVAGVLIAFGAALAQPQPQDSLEFGTWRPTQGDTCSAAVHNSYSVTVGGKRYSTWHPPVDPATGCTLGHEHGMDPRLAQADNTLPAFGLAAEAAGIREPHTGYKVDYVNLGDMTATAQSDYEPAPLSSRTVFHMGTGGTGRYSTQHHSLEVDAVWPSGHFVHVNVMADTGPTHLNGTANHDECDEQTKGLLGGSARRGAKDFSTVGCRDFYEIWNGVSVAITRSGQPRTAFGATYYAALAFDTPLPILTRDPTDNNRVLYTMDHWYALNPQYGWQPIGGTVFDYFKGCQHGVYHGPHYVANRGDTNIYTDAYGAAPGPLLQQVSQGMYASPSGAEAKTATDTCDPTVHAPN
jgi:hypothetical protein